MHIFSPIKIDNRDVFILFYDPIFIKMIGLDEFSNKDVIISRELAELLNVTKGSYLKVGNKTLRIIYIVNKSLIDLDGNPISYDLVSRRYSSLYGILPLEMINAFEKIYINKILFYNVSDIDLLKLKEIRLDISYLNKYSLSKEKTHIVGYDYPIVIGDDNLTLEVFNDIGEVFVADWYSQIILLFLGFLIISSNALASIYERKNDLTILTCIGASPMDLFINIISEGIGLGIMGGLGGFILGRLLNVLYTMYSGIEYLYPSIELSYLTYGLIIALFSSIIGYLIPARKGIIEVVPSKLLKRSQGKVAYVSKNELILDNFMRISLYEEKIIERYLKEIFPSKLEVSAGNWGFFVENIEYKEIEGSKVYLFNGNFKGLYVSNLVALTIKIILERYDGKINPKIMFWSKKLRSVPKGELYRLVIYTRDALMEYIDYKKHFLTKKI